MNAVMTGILIAVSGWDLSVFTAEIKKRGAAADAAEALIGISHVRMFSGLRPVEWAKRSVYLLIN